MRLSDTYSATSKSAMTGVAVASALSSLAIPDSTSDLTNDSGFITSADIPVTDVQDSSGNSLVSNGIATIPAIPTVPTNVSSFTNDAGYLTLSTLPIYDGSVS